MKDALKAGSSSTGHKRLTLCANDINDNFMGII